MYVPTYGPSYVCIHPAVVPHTTSAGSEGCVWVRQAVCVLCAC